LLLGILGALLLLGAAPTPETSPDEDVQVPVVLDGVRYAPDALNRMRVELNRQGIYLCYTFSRDGALHAFSSGLQGCHEFPQKEWGLPSRPLEYPPPVRPFQVRVEGPIVYVEPAIR